MLTRLQVKGFKNLVDVDVHFGPLTCIAGENGVGKSNLLDVISFLSHLADKPLVEAAMSVRDEAGRSADVRSIFHRCGERTAERIDIDVEMIVPPSGVDDLGQPVEATTTFLTYGLSIGFRSAPGLTGLQLLREELRHIRLGEANHHLRFPNKPVWRKSVMSQRGTGHRSAPFLSTGEQDGTRVLRLHQDGQGRPRPLNIDALPRTVVSTANAAEGPTMTLARREMQSWRLLQLEPSSLRRPSAFPEQPGLSPDGARLAATLHALGRRNPSVYARISNRLASLLNDVRQVWVDSDEKRELLTVMVKTRDGTPYPARALSDGTLRFLALAVLAEDPAATGALCLEEPENGIHPSRVPAILELLRGIALDPAHEAGDENPQRQVILNTHSPLVVAELDASELLFAYLQPAVRPAAGQAGKYERFSALAFGCMPGTWREKAYRLPVPPRDVLLPYIVPFQGQRYSGASHPDGADGRVKVGEHPWVQETLDFGSVS